MRGSTEQNSLINVVRSLFSKKYQEQQEEHQEHNEVIATYTILRHQLTQKELDKTMDRIIGK
jgi:hypothetical protein